MVKDSVVKVFSGSVQVSGVVLKSPALYVLTVSLPLGYEPMVQVELSNGQRLNAWVVGRDDTRNLALFKVIGTTSVPGIGLGDSTVLNTGTEVLAFGYPTGVTGAVSVVGARITDIRQDFSLGMRVMQLDTQPRPGASGGPVVNRNGEMVGISVDASFVQGLGLTVSPGAYALVSISIQQTMPQLQAGTIQLTPRPAPPPDPQQAPVFVLFQGNVTVGGALPPAGARVYARVVNAALGDIWAPVKGAAIKEDGSYQIAVGATSQGYANSPVEFYIDGIKAKETALFKLDAKDANGNPTFVLLQNLTF